MSEVNDTLLAGIEAMLDGNRIKFGDTVADILAMKASAAVDDAREVMAQGVFDFSDDEDEEGNEDVSDEVSEEDTEEDTSEEE